MTGAELTGAAGGGGAHNNLQPYIVLNYIIKALNAVPSERVDTDGTLFSNSDENVPSQKAVKSYVDNAVKFIGCSVYHNAYQTIPTNTSMGTAVILNSGYFDTDGMHDNSTNNSRITFKTAGILPGRIPDGMGQQCHRRKGDVATRCNWGILLYIIGGYKARCADRQGHRADDSGNRLRIRG